MTKIPAEDCAFRLDRIPRTFNGTSDYIAVPYTTDVSHVSDFSYEIFFTPNQEDSYGTIFSFEYNRRLLIKSNGQVLAQFRNASDDDKDIIVDNVIEMGVQNHIIITCDGTHLKLYHNGAQIGDTVTIESDLKTYTDGMNIGRDISSEGYFYKGTIKNFSIYNRGLTVQEVEDRYNKTTFKFENETPTTTQQNHIDWLDGLEFGRQ